MPFATSLLHRPRLRALAPLLALAALAALAALFLASGCGAKQPAAAPDNATGASPSDSATAALAGTEIVLFDWEEDMPPTVIAEFTRRTGVKVRYETYATEEEAVAKLEDGTPFDVAVIENQNLPRLKAAGVLHPIDYRAVPNFKNISANFRDLAFDPKNEYSVPYSWGTTGLLVRTDKVKKLPTKWADLWGSELAGRVAIRPQMQDIMGIALLGLGYQSNSEDPAQLAAAERRLMQLRPRVSFIEEDPEEAVKVLMDGKADVVVGWAADIVEGEKATDKLRYILPEEGTVLWGDSFVLPKSGKNLAAAQLFLDYLLEPEAGAAIVLDDAYATANEAAYPLVDPALRAHAAVYPPDADLQKAAIMLPLSPEGVTRYEAIWKRFMAEPK